MKKEIGMMCGGTGITPMLQVQFSTVQCSLHHIQFDFVQIASKHLNNGLEMQLLGRLLPSMQLFFVRNILFLSKISAEFFT
jgi:hypothetical protein